MVHGVSGAAAPQTSPVVQETTPSMSENQPPNQPGQPNVPGPPPQGPPQYQDQPPPQGQPQYQGGHQQPYPGQQPYGQQQPYPGQPGFGGQQPPKKKKTGLIIGAIVGTVLFLGLIVGGALLLLGGSDSKVTEAADAALQDYAPDGDISFVKGLDYSGEVNAKPGPLKNHKIISESGGQSVVVADGEITRDAVVPPIYSDGQETLRVTEKVEWKITLSETNGEFFTRDLVAKRLGFSPAGPDKPTDEDEQEATQIAVKTLKAVTNAGGAISNSEYESNLPDAFITGPGREGLNGVSDQRAGFTRVTPPGPGPKGGIKKQAESMAIQRLDTKCFVKNVRQVRTTMGKAEVGTRVEADRAPTKDLQVIRVSIPTKMAVGVTCSDYPSDKKSTMNFTPRYAVTLVRPAFKSDKQDWRVAEIGPDQRGSSDLPLYAPFDLASPFTPQG